MPNDDDQTKSKLPVILNDVVPSYKKPERRNQLVESEKYDELDTVADETVKIGTNGVAYVGSEAFPALFQLSKAKGEYVFDNQIPDKDKRSVGDRRYAHSSAVVGLLDKKVQEVRDAGKQALLQYSRDTLLSISDSSQAQDLRRKCDSFTDRELPKLRKQRGGASDELTGEPLKKGAAFHHVNPKEIHTDPEDVLNPSKGRNLNAENHKEVHRKRAFDEEAFESIKKEIHKRDENA